MVENYSEFTNLKFLYLIDEFENLSINQQRYINTLVKECEHPVTVYVGARLYGIKTYETLGGRDVNKPDSDFKPLYLDSVFRKQGKKYQKFVLRLCEKRLSIAGYSHLDIKSLFNSISDVDRISKIRKEYEDALPPHMARLRSNLYSFVLNGSKLTEAQIDGIVEKILVPDNAIVEKANILLLYRAWKERKDIIEAASKIQEESQKYLAGNRIDSPQERVLAKFKKDLIAQLLVRDFQQQASYFGFLTFVAMSEGLPRNLLTIIKNIFDWAIFYGERPFSSDHKISEQSQLNGLKESAEWFLREAGILGENGPSIIRGVTKFGNFLREMRYSDKPSECSMIAFSYDQTSTKAEIVDLLKDAEKYSLMVGISKGQKDRNSKSKNEKLQLSKMLAPYWDLPTGSRGAIALKPNEVEAIFGEATEDEFNKLKHLRLRRLNAPFNSPNNSNKKVQKRVTETLFVVNND